LKLFGLIRTYEAEAVGWDWDDMTPIKLGALAAAMFSGMKSRSSAGCHHVCGGEQ